MSRMASGFTVLILLLVITFVYGKFEGGFAAWFIFYGMLTVTVYEIGVHLLVLRSIKVTRHIERKRLTSGETIEVKLTILNDLFFPVTWLVIKDHLPSKLENYTQENRQLLFPWFRRRIEISYKVQNTPRGTYSFDKVELQTGDLFGFVVKTINISVNEDVIVYPKAKHIGSWHTVNEKNMGMTYALNRMAEDVTSVMGIRDYAHGDRLSRIHWKASARGLGLKTKEFEYHVSNDLMFFLDREEKGYGGREHPLFDRAVNLTASISRYAIDHHFTAGLVSYGQSRTVLPMARHQEHLLSLFEHMAWITADADYSFARTILKEVVYLPHGSTVVCISPQLTREIVLALGELSLRRVKVEFFWVTGVGVMTEEQQHLLANLETSGIPYKIVQNDDYDAILKGGGGHAIA